MNFCDFIPKARICTLPQHVLFWRKQHGRHKRGVRDYWRNVCCTATAAAMAISWNGMEHWKTWALRALHAGTLVTGILVAETNWLLTCMKSRGRSLPMAITPTPIYMFLQYRHQRAGLVEFYPVMYSLWRLDTAQGLTQLFRVSKCSTPFCEIAMAATIIHFHTLNNRNYSICMWWFSFGEQTLHWFAILGTWIFLD